jgi:hypothetical protein
MLKNLKQVSALLLVTALAACDGSGGGRTANTANSLPKEPTLAVEKLSPGSSDIALQCIKKSTSQAVEQSHILIYSEKYNVAKFGVEKIDGVWDPEYRINRKHSTPQEIEFDVTSYGMILAKRLNPSADIGRETIRINRQSLYMKYENHNNNVGYFSEHYECDILDNSGFEKHVQWVLNNTSKQLNANQI